MTTAPEIEFLSGHAALLARFANDLYVATRPMTSERQIESESAPDDSERWITRDAIRFVCDCGEGFTVDLLAGAPDYKVAQWVRPSSNVPGVIENHLIYARTQLDSAPCEHWHRIEL